VTADQVRTADLVNECIMFRDSLLRLPDAFTVGDFTDIMYFCARADCILLSVCLSVSLFSCFFLYLVYDSYNK